MTMPQQEKRRYPVSVLRPSSYCASSLNDSTNDTKYRAARERLTNKRKSGHKDDREGTSSKRVRFNPKYSGHGNDGDANIKMRSHMKRSRTRYLKAPSLLRPPIDRQYYMRIKPRHHVRMDKKIFWSTEITGGDKNDIDPKCFNDDSSLYEEITTKALRVKQAKQCQKLSHQEEISSSEYLYLLNT
jgi:hypothetical protein